MVLFSSCVHTTPLFSADREEPRHEFLCVQTFREIGLRLAFDDVGVIFVCLVNNENESVLEEPVEVLVNADKSSPAGTYTISLSGGKAKNYDITYEPGTLTVTKAPLTARVKNAERTYGAPNPSFQIEYTGLKNGETAPVWSTQPTVSCAATARSNVATMPLRPPAACPAIMNCRALRPDV